MVPKASKARQQGRRIPARTKTLETGCLVLHIFDHDEQAIPSDAGQED
jgi:hypothetical protein